MIFLPSPANAGVQCRRAAPNALSRALSVAGWAPAFAGEGLGASARFYPLAGNATR